MRSVSNTYSNYGAKFGIVWEGYTVRPKTLSLIRGLPGSGKNTLGEALAPNHTWSADDFFIEDGIYCFDPTKLSEAHSWCEGRVEEDLAKGVDQVAVCNTFSRRWEYQKYIYMARKYGYTVFMMTCQNRFSSVHHITRRAMENMQSRWEH